MIIMNKCLSEHQATAWIQFASSFRNDPIGFTKEDWMVWHSLIEETSQKTTSLAVKDEGIAIIKHFNQLYS
jgi:hypothetical protein